MGVWRCQVGQHNLHGQWIAIEQLEQSSEILVLAHLGHLVALEDEVSQVGSCFRVQPLQFVDVVHKRVRRQPPLAATRPQQHQGASAHQALQKTVQRILFGLRQRVLNSQANARDRLQVVKHQQMAAGAQPFGKKALLRLEAERLEAAQIFDLAQQLPGNGIHDLLARPCLLVIAKVEDLIDKTRGLPPVAQMMQQRGLARTTHAAHKQQVAVGEQAPLNVEDVQVAADKGIADLGFRVARRLALVERFLLFQRELSRS